MALRTILIWELAMPTPANAGDIGRTVATARKVPVSEPVYGIEMIPLVPGSRLRVRLVTLRTLRPLRYSATETWPRA